MAISFIGSASAEATSLTIPAGHQFNDAMLVYAFRDGSTTAPTIPAGWTSIRSNTGTLCSSVLCYKIASSGAETSGTWTNATALMVHVYRGVDALNPFGFGGAAGVVANTGTTSPSTYGSTAVLARRSDQWFAAFQCHASIDTTTMNNAPTGYTNIINAQTGATNNMVSFDTAAPTKVGFASNTVAPGGTASNWLAIQVPIWPSVVLRTVIRPHPFSPGIAR